MYLTMWCSTMATDRSVWKDMECPLHIFQQFTLCTNFATVWFSFMCSPNAACHYVALLCISAMAKCSSLVWMWFHFMVTNMIFSYMCMHSCTYDGNINMSTWHMLSNMYIPFPMLPHFCPSPHSYPNKIVAATCGGILVRPSVHPCVCVCVHAHTCMHACMHGVWPHILCILHLF
jgi:hypothetical protein